MMLRMCSIQCVAKNVFDSMCQFKFMVENCFSYIGKNLLCIQLQTIISYSLSARILHRAPPPPAPSGPKFSNSENCCGSENAMPPKIFWDMEGHRGNFR